MWKTLENDEYEVSTPAVQAHFHALRAEDALRRDDVVAAEREGRLASEKFLLAASGIANQRTVDALLLLAENYEYRAKQAKARIPQPVRLTDKDSGNLQAVGGRQPGSNADAAPPFGAATARETGLNGRENASVTSSASAEREPGKATVATADNAHDPGASAAAEAQLNLAAAEMEELWRKLQEIGLSSAGTSDKSNLLMSSRHLSSSLGDSFCLLPSKSNKYVHDIWWLYSFAIDCDDPLCCGSKTSIGVRATAVDGGSTLRAAVASRMRNQRVRLMEQQYGSRGIIDDRFHKQRSGSTSSKPGTPLNVDGGPDTGSHLGRRSSFGNNAGSGSAQHLQQQAAADMEGLQETISQQKYEIVRLLNTVKTLSSENTKLVKTCETLSNVQEENKTLQESMEKFKVHYNQKVWRIDGSMDQREERALGWSNPCGIRNAALEARLKAQEQQIAQMSVAMKTKDDQLAKYEKWYKTLKAGAKAKQRNSQLGANGGDNSGNGSSMDGGFANNSTTIGSSFQRDSFTNSSSFHDVVGIGEDAGGNSNGGRPPAHPNRRAL
ncbi:hypothetical protein FI667_g12336, partial [Globisporangium splendens]